jgi:hypothetical protein
MMRKAIDELEHIHSQLSEKDAMIVDQLCKKTAVMLWGHWLNDLQMQAKRVPAQSQALLAQMDRLKNHLVLLIAHPLRGLDHFQSLLDPHHSGLVLSKDFLDQACDRLLHVLENVQTLSASSQSALPPVHSPTEPVSQGVAEGCIKG